MKQLFLLSALTGALTIAAPALADVKAGVDAWQRGDYRAAVAQWRDPAIAGDADAQFNMGQAYKFGRGVPADPAQAEEWFRKAALQGHPQAEENYGLALFENGKKAQAVEWIERAAARGAPRSQYVLGTMLFNGDAVTRDPVRAYALIVRATAQGLPQAATAQAQMDTYISLADRQKGLELARVYERDAGRVRLATAAPPPRTAPAQPIARAELPPSTVAQPGGAIPVPQRPAPDKAVPERVVPRPSPTPAIRDGGWRLQLGAFGDAANARRLGASVAGRFAGRQVAYVKAGRLTKVLVGPFASSAEASAACRGLSPCVPVRD